MTSNTSDAHRRTAPDAPPGHRTRLDPTRPADGYHHALRGRDPHRWRGLLALVILAATFAVTTFVSSVLAVQVGVAIGAITEEQATSGRIPFGPLILLSTNLSLAALIPASFLIQRVLYGQPVRLLHSLAGRFRWRLVPRIALVAVPVWIVYLVLSSVLDLPGSDYSGGVAIALLAVVLLTTPFQAAGEEYGFRGVVSRAVGAWFRSPRTALVVSTIVASVLFMGAHASTDLWLNAYYLLFGVGMAIMTWRTGGLETAVAVHVVNNVLTLAVVALFNDGTAGTDRSSGTGSAFALVPIAAVAIVTAVVWFRTRASAAERPAGGGAPAAG
jgi:uncharacterized protein